MQLNLRLGAAGSSALLICVNLRPSAVEAFSFAFIRVYSRLILCVLYVSLVKFFPLSGRHDHNLTRLIGL